jgi:DNA polymerase III subunit epsilon
MANFTVVDVETANADLASICQIGVVRFQNGQIADTWSTLVNPEDDFHGVNVSIHGINQRAVAGAPRFPDVMHRVSELLAGCVVVCHTPFDRLSLSRAYQKYGHREIECTWLDSARVARRAWPEFARKGYGLANVARTIGIEFEHHDALEDARAAGEIVLRAVNESGLSVQEWCERLRQPITGPADFAALEVNADGLLFGETIVFTGALELPRGEAAALAAQAGCKVKNGVTKKTTILVIGDQDIRKLSGHDKSSKHRKAEELIAKGESIRILGEGDFQRLVAE